MKKWIAFSFAAFAIFVSISASMGWGKPYFSFICYIPFGDKVMHFTMIGLLSFFFNLAFPSKLPTKSKFYLLPISIILVFMVTLEEFSQIWLDRRSFDFIDLFCNYLGIFVFQNIAIYVLKRRTDAGTSISI